MTVITLFSRQIALLFTNDEEIIRGVTLSLFVVILSMIPQDGRVIQSGVLRGAGDAKFVAICALLSVTILRPALTYLFCYQMNMGVPGLFLANIISLVFRTLCSQFRFYTGRWLHKNV